MANDSEAHRSDGRPPGYRRALVFASFALVSWALYPLADRYDESDGWHWGSHGWAFVPAGLGAVYLVLLALLLAGCFSFYGNSAVEIKVVEDRM